MVTRFVCILSVSVLLGECGCESNSEQVNSCLEFLYAYMTPEDDLLHTDDFWEKNVAKTLEVRERMEWNVPEREFMHFVLPLKVCEETVDDFRLIYADSVCSRVEGMTISAAILEINRWIFERATFINEKPRLDSPLETLRQGYGNCNSLSELTVCALRAAGIPARQISVGWAHTAGAHSWIEAWADGKWHYIEAGARDPLDQCWISNAAPRVMLATIPVFGNYDGPENILGRTKNTTVVSNLKNYADVKNLKIIVLDSAGRVVPSAHLQFYVGIKEKKEFYSTLTGRHGTALLETGFGDCAVSAEHDGLRGVVKANAQDTVSTIVIGRMSEDEADSIIDDMELTPPSLKPLLKPLEKK